MRPLTWGHGDDLVEVTRVVGVLLVDDIDIVPEGWRCEELWFISF